MTVTTPHGTSAVSSKDRFKYIPSVTGVSPNAGPKAGGTSVTVAGTGFAPGNGTTTFTIGASPATMVTCSSTTACTLVTAAHAAATLDVKATVNGVSSARNAPADQFSYVLAPIVSEVAPKEGPEAGGTSLTITGANLSGASAVKFGSANAASFTVNSATSITARAPASGAATVDVTVTTPGGTSATSEADRYTYVPPPGVSAIAPKAGPQAGGTSVAVSGVNLTHASAVKFGSANAASYTVNSATSITASAPAGSGTVEVTVTTAGGTSATSEADRYTYVPPPAVTEVTPNTGPSVGGTSVVITGTNFTGASAVKFGPNSATSFTVASATSITAVAPAGSGTVDVTVTTTGGTSAISEADHFTYIAVPGPAGASGSLLVSPI